MGFLWESGERQIERMEQKGEGAGGRYGEVIVSRLGLFRGEGEGGGAEVGSFHFGVRDGGEGLDTREMLGCKPRVRSFSADVVEVDGGLGGYGKR
jgi:hypothetical protein